MIKKIDLNKRNSFGKLDWLEKWNEPSGAKLIEEKINEIIELLNAIVVNAIVNNVNGTKYIKGE